MALKYEVNKIQVNLANYRHYLRGQPKLGKTTFFRDFIMELYGDPKYGLLISLGQESGYKALSNLTVMPAPDWYTFVEIVDDLVEHPEDNEFKFVCLDTVDRGFEIAEKRVLDIHRATKGEIATSIDAALGGYAKGKAKAKSILEEQVSRLENAGYGQFWIGHTKLKQLGDQVTDTVYEKVTGSLEFKYDGLFSDRADFMPMLATESVATKEEKLKESKRFIYFRSTLGIDAGSRIEAKHFPEKIEYSAKGYIDTVTKALESAAGVSGKKAEEKRKEEEVSRVESGKKFSESQKVERYGDENEDLESLKKKTLELAKSLSEDDAKLKREELKTLGLTVKFSTVEDIEELKKIHAVFSRVNA